MSEVKFTKGEWIYSDEGGLIYIKSDEIGCVCMVEVFDPDYTGFNVCSESRANAHLIKTAPKMYRKLESILKSLPIANETDEQEALRFEIMDLLAEARGES